jgi:hypothetical protein
VTPSHVTPSQGAELALLGRLIDVAFQDPTPDFISRGRPTLGLMAGNEVGMSLHIVVGIRNPTHAWKVEAVAKPRKDRNRAILRIK